MSTHPLAPVSPHVSALVRVLSQFVPALLCPVLTTLAHTVASAGVNLPSAPTPITQVARTQLSDSAQRRLPHRVSLTL